MSTGIDDFNTYGRYIDCESGHSHDVIPALAPASGVLSSPGASAGASGTLGDGGTGAWIAAQLATHVRVYRD